MIIYSSNKENNNSKRDHCYSSPDPHRYPFFFLPRAHFFKQIFLRGQKKYGDERKKKKNIVEKQIRDSGKICNLIMQKPQHHKIRSSRAGKFAKSHEHPHRECRRQRRFVHQLRYFCVRRIRNFQFDRKSRKDDVNEIYPAERDQERCSQFAHKVRGVKNVQGVEYAEADQNVGDEDAENIKSPYLQNIRAEPPNAEQERNG